MQFLNSGDSTLCKVDKKLLLTVAKTHEVVLIFKHMRKISVLTFTKSVHLPNCYTKRLSVNVL